MFAENPLHAVQMIENEIVFEEELKDKKSRFRRKNNAISKSFHETSILENTVRKIAALITLGLGNAGSEIISKNIQSNGNVDPIIPGKKVFAIYGFCRITNFNEMTDIFQEEVLDYINIIAEIVHNTVDGLYGFPNKNIGDTFLVAWKFPNLCFDKASLEFSHDDLGELPIIKNSLVLAQYADMALIAFIKIHLRTSVSYKLKSLQAKKQYRLNKYSTKNQLSMGLHLGWAIEGAIGSYYKIEASYLSPNVNLSARIESANKYYGTNLMLSDKVYNLLSAQAKEYVRLIDFAVLKGCQDPIKLYTTDIDMLNIQSKSQKETKLLTYKEICVKKYFRKIKKTKKYREILSGVYLISKLLEKDSELCGRVNYLPNEFYEFFQKGVNEYIDGNWEMASNLLVEAQNFAIDNAEFSDEPTLKLLSFMGSYKFQAPKDWKGYRIFGEK